ncbi:MAG: EamA family transporter [Acidobacteria bacterium]|nr:EamA family transporter [Acidobacteriota bacterium]
MIARRLVWKTALVTLVVILANVSGNLFLTLGMKSAAGIFSPWVFTGVLVLIGWTLSRMTLLSWADLSFVLPVTAIGYPLNALMGQWLLNEQVTGQRWLGTAFIVAGAILVGLTMPSTRRDAR